ncbi:hypothetical protein [Caulobacter sp. RL271]|uniref:DUF4760 domain-containing protein n=1 Tax=Caulobacter segnis TaxID=88688 RepID=A0ABY4ZWI8_9CAUL|nr:hypothetical protein [Caulobacter segnis]USQ96524.1 hypothetical protein MZV50_02715 [Caulobacter segnis]
MKFFDRVLAVGALIYAALFLSVVAQKKGLFSSDMASWVQAFGSIAAMWVAYSLARVASRENDRRRREDQIAVTAAAIELVVEIVSVFDDARETFESSERLGQERFAVAQKAIDRFPYASVRDTVVISALRRAENAFAFFEPRYETFMSANDRNSPKARRAMDKMIGCSTEARSALQELNAFRNGLRRADLPPLWQLLGQGWDMWKRGKPTD